MSILYFILGLFVGLYTKPTLIRVEELLYIRKCKTPFSQCLDCELHNSCSRYSRHED
jgi:hypothetical protein